MFIGNLPPTYRAPLCDYCGRVTDDTAVRNGYAAPVCEGCDTRNLASDLWKDLYGARPRFFWPLREQRAFLANHTTEA